MTDDGDTDFMDPDVFDLTCVNEWFDAVEYVPALPPAADGQGFVWAHENPRIWDRVKPPAGMTAVEARQLMVDAVNTQPRST